MKYTCSSATRLSDASEPAKMQIFEREKAEAARGITQSPNGHRTRELMIECMVPTILKLASSICLLCTVAFAIDRGQEIPLWSNGAPGSQQTDGARCL
jgi:hypothetical protein